MSILDYLMSKVHEAMDLGIEGMSVSEGLMCALVLNRFDWLSNRGYTIAQALGRIDEAWVSLIPKAAARLRSPSQSFEVIGPSSEVNGVDVRFTAGTNDVDLRAKLVDCFLDGNSGQATFVFDVCKSDGVRTYRLHVRICYRDSETIVQQILSIKQGCSSTEDVL